MNKNTQSKCNADAGPLSYDPCLVHEIIRKGIEDDVLRAHCSAKRPFRACFQNRRRAPNRIGWGPWLAGALSGGREALLQFLVHSDQGSQFTSREWQAFLRQHNLVPSMSRRGNCHDNAVAESFFQLLKRERVRRKTYPTRETARQDVFEYIEMFYNPKRKHTNNGMLSPVDFETRQLNLNKAGV